VNHVKTLCRDVFECYVYDFYYYCPMMINAKYFEYVINVCCYGYAHLS